MTSEAARPAAPSLATSRWRHLVAALDLRVLGPALALVTLGLIALASDRPAAAAAQLRWTAAGVTLFLAVLVVPYRRMLQLIYPAFAVTLVLLVLVLFFGRTTNQATRWLSLGPIGFQPSEVAKVALVAVLARYIRFRRDHRTIKGLVVPFLLTLVPLALIVKQPDLGTALMLVPVLFAMLWAAGAQPRHLRTVVLLGVLSLPIVYFGLKPYQRARIHAFAAPVAAMVGIGADGDASSGASTVARADTYHVERSVTAIAAGGLTGSGFGEGLVKNRVPESSTDFVFTVFAEEWGFLGVLLLMGLECALLLGLASIAREEKEPAARLLAVGAMVLFGVQACVNLAMTVGLAPITGLPLPFLSYGGSSMLTCWLLLGLALNVRAHRPVVFAERDFD